MNRPAKLILCFCLLSTLALAQAPSGRLVTIDDTMKYQSVSGVQLSPDGRNAAYVVSVPDFDENTSRTNIYLVDADGKGMKLTNSAKHDEQPRWSPDGRWLAFLSDRPNKPEKSGQRQIWIISPSGGEAWQLTRTRLNITTFEWAPDGKSIAIVATEPDTDQDEKRKKDKDDALLVESDLKMARIYLASVPGGETELLYSSDRHISNIDFSPKGDEIAFADQPSPKVPDGFHSIVHVLDIKTKKARVLAGGDMSNSDPNWSPDGNYIAYQVSSQTDWSSNSNIYVVPSQGGTATNLTAAFDERVGGYQWANDSSAIYFTGSKGVDAYIYKAGLDAHVSPLFQKPGQSRSFSIKNSMMAFVYESASEPNDIYIASLVAPKPDPKAKTKPVAWQFTPKKVTNSNPQVADLRLGKTEIVHWKNKLDGMEMEGLVVLPPDYVQGKKYPLLLVIHGGPAGQYSSTFSMRRGAYPIQVFASQGYVVFMPNPRGSGGYGEKFRKANLKDWGGADFKDIQDGVDDLIAKGIADADRMGVMGWSYGGYMTSWTITQTSRFKAASVGAGVTNLVSFYGTTDIPPFQESYFGGAPWQTGDLIRSRSAMFFVDKVTTPTLIQHGQADQRVPLSQGVELYTALRRLNVPTEMVQYPRQPHGIGEPKLLRDSAQRNLDWFDRYVMGNEKAAPWHKKPAGTAEK